MTPTQREDQAWVKENTPRLKTIRLGWMNSSRTLYEMLTARLPEGRLTIHRSRQALATVKPTYALEPYRTYNERVHRADSLDRGLVQALDFKSCAWGLSHSDRAVHTIAWAQEALLALGRAHIETDTVRGELAAVRQYLQEVAAGRLEKSRLARARALEINRLKKTVSALKAELAETRRDLELRDTQLQAKGEALTSVRHALGLAERAVSLLEMAAGRRVLEGADVCRP